MVKPANLKESDLYMTGLDPFTRRQTNLIPSKHKKNLFP
jgi:hypothetical protein